MRVRAFNGTTAALAVFVGATSASAQIVEPRYVVPPPAQKTTVSGTLTAVVPSESQRQQIQKNRTDAPGIAPPAQVNYCLAEVTSLLSPQPPASQESPLTQEFTPWLSAPSRDWFMLAPKDSPKSWEPPLSAKDAAFDQPAKTDTNAWQQKPKAAFDSAPPAAPTHSWDDNPDPRLKGSKVDWK